MFTNLDQFKREYFPDTYKEEKEMEKLEKMTTEEKGRYFGEKTMEKVKILFNVI